MSVTIDARKVSLSGGTLGSYWNLFKTFPINEYYFTADPSHSNFIGITTQDLKAIIPEAAMSPDMMADGCYYPIFSEIENILPKLLLAFKEAQSRIETMEGASGGSVPTSVGSSAVYSVSANTQSLYAEEIDVDGEIVINGCLTEVV